MGLKNSISILISFACLFSSVHAKAATGPAAAPNSGLAPSPSREAHGGSSLFFMNSKQQGEEDINHINANPTVKSLCSDKDHPKVCVDTLLPYIEEGDPKSQPAAVLELAVKLTFDQAREGLALAEKLLANRSTSSSPAFQSCLQTCVKTYQAILISNRVTLDAITGLDYYTMNKELNTNIKNVDACDGAFAAAGIKSPLVTINDVLGKMVVNNLGFGKDMVRP